MAGGTSHERNSLSHAFINSPRYFSFSAHRPAHLLHQRIMPSSFTPFNLVPLPCSRSALHLHEPPSSSHTIKLRARVDWANLSRCAQDALSSIDSSRKSPSYALSLRELVDADSSNPFLWLALAKCYSVQLGDVPTAVRILEEAVSVVPTGLRGGLYENLGTLESKRGNIDRALSIFTNALVSDPFVSLYTSLALTQTKYHMIDDARETFRQGMLAFPNHASLFRACAHFESIHGTLDTAMSRWREALQRDRGNARAWAWYLQLHRRGRADLNTISDLLFQAVAACPRDVWLRLTLAKIEEKRKGLHSARSVLLAMDVVEELNILRYLGRLEFELGNKEAGRMYFKKAVECEAKGKEERRGKKTKRKSKRATAKALHAWALMESKFDDPDAARELLHRALVIAENDTANWRALGEIEARERNYDKAREAFQRAVEIDPNDSRLYLAWGRTESKAGNSERAASLIDRVSDLESINRRRISKTPREENPLETSNLPDYAFESDDRKSLSLTPRILASALRERAVIAARDGRYEDSIQLLTRATSVEPNSEMGWRLLASHELRLQGIESARVVYERALEKLDRRAQYKVLRDWAQDERSLGNIEEARDLLERTVKINPTYMSTWVSWGLLEKSQGNVEKACHIFQKATRIAEKQVIRAPFLFQAWGRVEEIDRGNLDKAASIFQRGVRLAPEAGPLWTSWAMLERRRGNIEKARELFQMATAVEPKLGSTWQSWGIMEAQRGNFKKAEDLFQTGNEHEPKNASLLASWALMEGRDRGHVAVGRDLYERATNADPFYGPAWHSWGCLEMATGNINRARDLFEKASKTGEGVSAWHSLGVLEAEHCENAEAAIKNWKRALELSPDHSMCYQSWALLRGRSGDLEDARRIFQDGIDKAKDRHDDIVKLLQAWAELEDHSGSGEKARELLRRSLEIDPKRAETWDTLAHVEKQRGLREEARQLLNQGVDECCGSSKWVLYSTLGNLEGEDGNAEKMREVFSRGIQACPSSEELWKSYIGAEKLHGSVKKVEELQSRFAKEFAKCE